MKKHSLQKVLIVSKKIEHADFTQKKNQAQAVRQVEHVLEKHGLFFHTIPRGKLKKIEGFDLIVSVGGDGTFLDSSHYLRENPLMVGINSNPKTSHGAYCHTDASGFENLLERILAFKAPLVLLNRIRCKLGKKTLPILALNDVLLANPIPAGTTRYLVQIGKIREEQKSSGIWISTASGSTAAIHSAGGKIMPLESKKLQYLVREPFLQGGKHYRIQKGFLSSRQKIVFIPQMSRGYLFVDGYHVCYPIQCGERVEIELANKPIRAVLE